jgi:hypothetical protein
MTCTHSRWHVAQTHSHAEKQARAHLMRQCCHVYLPRYLKRHRHARRIENVSAPLFPRYLFGGGARFNQPSAWRISSVAARTRPPPASYPNYETMRASAALRIFICAHAPPRATRSVSSVEYSGPAWAWRTASAWRSYSIGWVARFGLFWTKTLSPRHKRRHGAI